MFCATSWAENRDKLGREYRRGGGRNDAAGAIHPGAQDAGVIVAEMEATSTPVIDYDLELSVRRGRGASLKPRHRPWPSRAVFTAA